MAAPADDNAEKNAAAADGPLEEHFLRPRNAGELADADLSVRVENPVCGDLLDLHLRRGSDGRIAACGFQVYGCPAAIAAGSMLTELIAGRSKEECEALTLEQITTTLGALPKAQLHAVHLAFDALQSACSQWNAP